MDLQELKSIKEQIKKDLPFGFVTKIQANLLAKNIERSRGYISKVCNPEYKNYDLDIILEAQRLAAAEKEKWSQIKAQAV